MTRLSLILLLTASAAALAEPAPSDGALRPETALACAAERYHGEALRIDAREDGLVQVIVWRTPAGHVIEIRLGGPNCRFLEVRGVGQTEARRLPEAAK